MQAILTWLGIVLLAALFWALVNYPLLVLLLIFAVWVLQFVWSLLWNPFGLLAVLLLLAGSDCDGDSD